MYPIDIVLELQENGGVRSREMELNGVSIPGVDKSDRGLSLANTFGLLKASTILSDLGRVDRGFSCAHELLSVLICWE